jgi:hypothetical protein
MIVKFKHVWLSDFAHIVMLVSFISEVVGWNVASDADYYGSVFS